MRDNMRDTTSWLPHRHLSSRAAIFFVYFIIIAPRLSQPQHATIAESYRRLPGETSPVMTPRRHAIATFTVIYSQEEAPSTQPESAIDIASALSMNTHQASSSAQYFHFAPQPD